MLLLRDVISSCCLHQLGEQGFFLMSTGAQPSPALATNATCHPRCSPQLVLGTHTVLNLMAGAETPTQGSCWQSCWHISNSWHHWPRMPTPLVWLHLLDANHMVDTWWSPSSWHLILAALMHMRKWDCTERQLRKLRRIGQDRDCSDQAQISVLINNGLHTAGLFYTSFCLFFLLFLLQSLLLKTPL